MIEEQLNELSDTFLGADEDLIALCPSCPASYDMDDMLIKKEYSLEFAGPQQFKIGFG